MEALSSQEHVERIRTVEKECHEQLKAMRDLHDAVYNVSDIVETGQAEIVDSGRPDNQASSEQRRLARALSQLRDYQSECQQDLKRREEEAERYKEAITKEKKETEKVAALLEEQRRINSGLQSQLKRTEAALENEKKTLRRLRQKGYGICHELRWTDREG